MISAVPERRRKVLFTSAFCSAFLHLLVLGVLFFVAARWIVPPAGTAEHLSETTSLRLEQRPQAPQPRAVARRAVAPAHQPPAIRRPRVLPPPRQIHELAAVAHHARPQPPVTHRSSIAEQLAAQQQTFANEVATLNQENNPHAIATIDPATQQSASKSYRFGVGGFHGAGAGNGVITPTQRWKDHGRDCYYGRYEYEYGDGRTEDGDIVWPFCYDPANDPFHEPPHSIPFPLPMAGYSLPSGTALPPLEKEVYDRWASVAGG